jgi:hypothetical protein
MCQNPRFQWIQDQQMIESFLEQKLFGQNLNGDLKVIGILVKMKDHRDLNDQANQSFLDISGK